MITIISQIKKIKTAVALIASLLVMLIFTVSLRTVHATTADEARMDIAFYEPLPATQVFQLFDDKPVRIEALKSTFDLHNAAPYTDYYFLKGGESLKDISSNFLKERDAFIADTLSNLRAMPVGENMLSSDRVKKQIASFENFVQNKDAHGELNIHGVVLRGEKPVVKSILRKLELQDDLKTYAAMEQQNLAPLNPQPLKPLGVSNYWTPAEGYSYVYPSSYGGRYSSQYIWWPTTIGFTVFDTYEHDFFLNNYDGKTYLSAAQDSWGNPSVSYASTSLPYPYLDTRYGDPSGEKAYTIGSASAISIKGSTDYFYQTYIRTTDGNTSNDTAKIQAQRGYRNPTLCYSTWCSYASETINLISAWNVSVPGSATWWQ